MNVLHVFGRWTLWVVAVLFCRRSHQSSFGPGSSLSLSSSQSRTGATTRRSELLTAPHPCGLGIPCPDLCTPPPLHLSQLFRLYFLLFLSNIIICWNKSCVFPVLCSILFILYSYFYILYFYNCFISMSVCDSPPFWSCDFI